MTKAEHVIAKCEWSSNFDQQSKAFELQNYISQWSNTELVQEMDHYFTQICPSNQTWRIDTLQLDLGEIELENLQSELPERFRNSLYDAFDRLFAEQHMYSGNSRNNNFLIVDHIESLQEYIRWFFKYGYVPWWFKGSETTLQIFDNQVAQNPHAMEHIIRDLGRSDVVRKRIVWQLGEQQIRKIIYLLEPMHGNVVCSYADNVFLLQSKRKLVPTNQLEFKQQMWLLILTHLLVDRGTLFNTVAFVAATLKQLAQYYKIDYQQLLSQLNDAVKILNSQGLATTTFITAVTMIHQQEIISQQYLFVENSESKDYWPILKMMLHGSVKQEIIDNEVIEIDELFSTLSYQNPIRMASLLKQECESQKIYDSILDKLNVTGQALVSELLVPNDHGFILVYADSLKILFNEWGLTERKIWQVLLKYIILDRSSCFNRQVFISTTLQLLSKFQALNYDLALDLLMNVIVEKPTSRHFNLISVCQHLKSDLTHHKPQSNIPLKYTQNTIDYLVKDFTNPLPHNNTSEQEISNYKMMFYDVLNVQVNLNEQGLGKPNTKILLIDLIREAKLQNITDNELSLRLLKMIRPMDLSTLLDAIEPNASTFCCLLMSRLLHWHKRFWLPCLVAEDLAYHFQLMIIQALLLNSRTRTVKATFFDLATFWYNFILLVQQKNNINTDDFKQQLLRCIENSRYRVVINSKKTFSDANNYKFLNELKPILLKSEITQKWPVYIEKNIKHWNYSQLLHTLGILLGIDDADINKSYHLHSNSVNNGIETYDVSIELLLQIIIDYHSCALLQWLNRQPNCSDIVKKLRSFSGMNTLHYFLDRWYPLGSSSQVSKVTTPLLWLGQHQQGHVVVFPKTQLIELFLNAERQAISNNELSRLLISFIKPSDFKKLVDLIQPQATQFCIELLENLQNWNKRAWLPSLNKLDFTCLLYKLLVQALLGGRKKQFSVEFFWSEFSNLLSQHGVEISFLCRQLQRCFEKQLDDENSIKTIKVLLSYLCVSQTEQRSTKDSKKEIVVIADTAHWTQSQLFNALYIKLTQSAGTIHSSQSVIPLSLSVLSLQQLWNQIETRHNAGLLVWLNNHPDKSLLLQALIKKRYLKSIKLWLMTQLPKELNPPNQILKKCYTVFYNTGLWHGSTTQLEQELELVFWVMNFDITIEKIPFDLRLARFITVACLRLDIRLRDCLDSIKCSIESHDDRFWQQVYPVLQEQSGETGRQSSGALITDNRVEKNKNLNKPQSRKAIIKFRQDYSAKYLKHAHFHEIFRELLQNGCLPKWVETLQPIEIDRMVFDVFTVCPNQLTTLIGDLKKHQDVMFRLLNLVPFSLMIDAIRKVSPDKESISKLLEEFNQCLQKIRICGINNQQQTGVFFQLVFHSWLCQEWNELKLDRIINRYIWQLQQQYRLDKTVLQQAFSKQIKCLSEPLILALAPILTNSNTESDVVVNINKKTRFYKENDGFGRNLSTQFERKQVLKTPISINNSGLVILQSFITPLFKRLGLIEKNEFISKKAQRRGVHFLQFLVTGCQKTSEHYLILNKILCGMALYEPVELYIELSTEEKEMCESLISSVVVHWSEIGNNSIDGFRGNWLVRNGSLTEVKDHWNLIVERRAYDLLLAKSPLSYSVIKLPWMEKAIYVTWPT